MDYNEVAAGVDGDQGLAARWSRQCEPRAALRPWAARRVFGRALPPAVAARRRRCCSPPLGWFVLIYLAALVVLFISAFWRVDPFTGEIVHDWSLDNFRTIFDDRDLPRDRAAHDRDRRAR